MAFLAFSPIFILLSFSSLGLCDPIPANITISWFDQKVDHFSYSNTDRFKQRVITSTDHFGGDGSPIFFYTGNEGDIFSFANNTGFMWERAAEFKAMVIFVEHRYYGESMPYGNQSTTDPEKFGYLTVEQALADFAEFLTDLKLNNKETRRSPVISFGGSYGGMLSSWFRMKYPWIIEGALAASAPIWQFTGIYDCNGYYRIVSEDLRGYSDECADSVKNSWPAIRRLGSTEEGRNWLRSTFKTCGDITGDDDIDKFVVWISGAYENVAMTDYPNPADFLSPMPAYPIREMCKQLNDSKQDDKALITSVYRAVSIFYNYTGKTDCFDIGNAAPTGMDNWDYQFCTEMVLPVCANGIHDVFEEQPWNITKFSNDCQAKYQRPSEPLKGTWMFGGKDIQTASNIIFSNGARDPWSAGGVTEQVSPNIDLIKIPGACHHEDLRPRGKNDPPALVAVRELEAAIIRGWLTAYYERIGHTPHRWMKFVDVYTNEI